jgi:acetyltransferase-like isoleucine patch superfamily enzyme
MRGGRLARKIYVVLRGIALRAEALSRGSWISFSAKLYAQPGSVIRIGRNVRVLHASVISILPGAELELRDGCIINHGCVVYSAQRVTIGRNTRVAHYCSIVDHDYDFRSATSLSDAPARAAAVYIGDEVWLGASVVVLKGVSIGNRSVVGAHAVVSRLVPADTVAISPGASQLEFRTIVRAAP